MYAAPTDSGEQPLETILRPIHQGWMEDARRYLDHARNPGAEFWTRWAAVRYLNDGFLDRFEWERAFVQELRGFLPVDATERLQRQGDRLARLRLELDRVGRRRGTGSEVAGTTQEFLEQLALWCAAIEAAARVIPRDVLTEEGATLLAHLETAELLRP
jgi:GNAT superfamily N-acetyltransferase